MKVKWLNPVVTLLTLMFCMSVFCFPVYATELPADTEAPAYSEVEEINDPVDAGSDAEIVGETGEFETEDEITLVEKPESLVPVGSGFRPFTPPGEGTVVDNAIDGDGKEFYTISTEDGDVFYLIIDRQRNSQNVYFLNAVTELDLLALAAKNEREIPVGTITTPPGNRPAEGEQEPIKTPEPGEPSKQSDKTVMYIIIAVAFVGTGAAAYYFKIVKRKKELVEDDYDDESDYDDEYDFEDETDNDGEAEDGGEQDE